MFIVNKNAIHLFSESMEYEDTKMSFKNSGHGDIPFGEYLLMLGITVYADRHGFDRDIVVKSMGKYLAPSNSVDENMIIGGDLS